MERRAVTRGRPIRVLIVDDSAIVRKVLSDVLAGEHDIEVVGTAPDPYIARDKILALEPDVLTLDIEMPRMDGLTFLEKLMRYRPMPVIMISSLAGPSTHAAVEGLRRGAVEVLAKPGGPYSVGELKAELAGKIRAAAASRPRVAEEAPTRNTATQAPVAPADLSGLVVIGASTGGTQAIEAVLRNLPPRFPAIAIVQHIPSGFSRAFAERLNKLGPLRVSEAFEGQTLEPGLALIAPGDYHMKLERAGGGWRARVGTGPKVCYQRPSVDVLFESAAREAGGRATAILLTGMGSDGAEGMLTMRRAGAYTIAQNEATCIVFGMPREAIQRGAAEQVAGLSEIPGLLLRRLARSAAPPTAPRPWQTA
jgi:two-component system, chemotaxis family, protein-glutamate methylesterase/glutaminase